MWLFGKRLNIKKAARGEEESSCPEDLPVFAPEIETGISDYTEPEVQSEIADELPTFDEDEDFAAYESYTFTIGDELNPACYYLIVKE